MWEKDKFELNIGIDSAQSYDMHEAYVEAHRAWTAAAEKHEQIICYEDISLELLISNVPTEIKLEYLKKVFKDMDYNDICENIALMKVFGYRKKEIKKLYLDGNFYMIAIGALISVPLSKKLMDAMYPVMVSNIACGMNLSFTWQMYALIYAGIIITYLVINKLLVRKIYKVGLSDALKES